MINQELLDLRFFNWSDATLRHTVFVSGVTRSDKEVASCKSAYFDGGSYLQVIDNIQDWMLGSTLSTSPISKNWTPSASDNNFTIDTWVYPIESSIPYYPICSSFQSVWYNKYRYDLGWVLHIESSTRKLQLISYVFGSFKIVESTLSVPFNQWSHIALMSWPQSKGSAKLFFVNGVPDGGFLRSQFSQATNPSSPLYTEQFPISNAVSHESQYGVSGRTEYCPFYIGLGPRSDFTDPNLVESFYFDAKYGICFRGNIGRFRVCLGTRYSQQMERFNPLVEPTSSTTSTTVTTTTTTLTTTTRGEWGEIPISINDDDLLVLKLRNDLTDLTNRHLVVPQGEIIFSLTDLGTKSIYFDGSNYLLVTLNHQDFSLGSSLLVSDFSKMSPLSTPYNEFSLEFWVYPIYSGRKYLGICGSFSENFFPADSGDSFFYGEIESPRNFQSGWSLQIDTLTGLLQFIGYEYGSVSSVMSSTVKIPDQTWTHVVIASVPNGDRSYKYILINGVPDSINPYKNPFIRWTNGIHRDSVNSSVNCYSPLYIGLGAFTEFSEETLISLNYTDGSKFHGYLSSFKLSSTCHYDLNGFTPYRIPLPSTTATTLTTVTTSQTTRTSTTPPPEGYVRVGGALYVPSSLPGSPPEYATDSIDSTAWEPLSGSDVWIGIECDDSTD